jgi:hypothetical protein
MLFVFLFIFFKINYIFGSTVALDKDESLARCGLHAPLRTQDSNSPPRKSRRNKASQGTKIIDDTGKDDTGKKEAKAHSPYRKPTASARKRQEKEKEKENLDTTVMPSLVSPTMSAGPETALSLEAGFDVTSDEEEDDSPLSLVKIKERSSKPLGRLHPPSFHDDSEDEGDAGKSPSKETSFDGYLSPEQREKFSEEFSVATETVRNIEIVNFSLYLQLGDPFLESLLGSDSDPAIRQAIKKLKEIYSSPIRKLDLKKTFQLLTPALREFLTRSEVIRAKEGGWAESLPADAFKVTHAPETPEEKAERKKAQEESFLELERSRGKSPLELCREIEAEARLWENHFAYIQLRKEKIASGTERKIRKGEIIDTFRKFVESHYQLVSAEGYDIYYSMTSLELGRLDKEGRERTKTSRFFMSHRCGRSTNELSSFNSSRCQNSPMRIDNHLNYKQTSHPILRFTPFLRKQLC